MITCHKSHLEARCRERGYTLAEVMPCVVSQDGEMWTIDETNWAYPVAKPNRTPKQERSDCLAGTELKALLRFLGFTSTPTCPCNARAAEMDQQGCDWCEENIDTVVGWLEEQAVARGLPFLRAGAKVIVRRAIFNARRKSGQKGNKK